MTAIKRFFFQKKQDVDMTQGSIFKHLLLFAIPLLLGNLFQQFYNMVDTWVVGNYVSNEAFAAVGSVGPIINTFIGFYAGLSGGAGAVLSQYYGAKREDKVSHAAHTAVLATLILGVVLSVAGILLVPFMLRITKTPEEVYPQAKAYLVIYFSGILFQLLYNIGAGILRAVGDSRRPFYFLVVSALTNVVLDLVFVLVFKMGVEGVAYATVISQFVAVILTYAVLLRTSSCVKIKVKELRIDWDLLKKIIYVGIPSGLQLAITAFSNVFVQSYINAFQADVMSAWTAYSKIDMLMFLPMQSVAIALTTFVAQNLGGRQPERAKKGVRISLLMALGCTVVLMIPMIIFAPSLVAIFNKEAAVIEYGTMFLRFLTPFYIACCFNQVLPSAMRGSGNTRAPMVIMLISFVAFRQVYLFLVANYFGNHLLAIAMGYPAGWWLCAALSILYYLKVGFGKGHLIEEAATPLPAAAAAETESEDPEA